MWHSYHPSTLLGHVASCFATRPGGSRVCVIEETNLIAWPKGLRSQRRLNWIDLLYGKHFRYSQNPDE
jgi:hypothetical protein